MAASRFIEGRPAGTWRAEGVRADDPNDVIAHEDRRELRGERFLAAWVNHWDSRGPNTYDAYVEADEGGGYLLHYFLDFGDCLGTTPARNSWPEPRAGFASVLDLPTILADLATFGAVRRPWDEVRADPRYPNLGFFGVERFEPLSFSPQTPLLRWARAQPSDLAWMARRMARLGAEHIRAAVGAGRLSDPQEAVRLAEVLMGRRRRILRASFDEVSPLADLSMTSPTRLCATDLAVTSGVSAANGVSYATRVHEGAALRRSSRRARLTREEGGRVCVELPPFFAPDDAPDEAPERYATLDILRIEGSQRTVIRAHFYELGTAHGYVLVGVERR